MVDILTVFRYKIRIDFIINSFELKISESMIYKGFFSC